jgi:hypothetical protein
MSWKMITFILTHYIRDLLYIKQVGVYPLRPGGSRTLVGRLVPVSVSRVMSFCYFSYVNINKIHDIKKSGVKYFCETFGRGPI